MILDHNKRPRNKGTLDPCTNRAEGFNPLCGDRVFVTMVVDGHEIRDIRFDGQGCAISTASASMMTEALKGRSLEDAHQIFDEFHKMVVEEGGAVEWPDDLASLEALGGVREFPVRVKCATLAWHTMEAALAGASKTTTE